MSIRPGKMFRAVIAAFFKKPATGLYPFTRVDVPKGVRGAIEFFSEKCIGCKMCMRDCPAGAIVIRQVAEKKYEAEFNLGKCVYCGQCAESCIKKALAVTSGFELAQLTKDKLKVIYHVEPPHGAEKVPEED
jgi:formate hydrogenlyase subunit 6/NADH:ubiquinone oxidoreductase subunit I